jgi:phosphoribosylformylglycinamidine synthase
MAPENLDVIPGGLVYSDFRRTELLALINSKLQASGQQCKATTLSSNYIHYISIRPDGASDFWNNVAGQRQNLHKLLGGSKAATPRETHSRKNSVQYFIWPRSLSPWSSKATSIAYVCGLESALQRIERGYAVQIEFDGPATFESQEPFVHLIHDRMTQVCT